MSRKRSFHISFILGHDKCKMTDFVIMNYELWNNPSNHFRRTQYVGDFEYFLFQMIHAISDDPSVHNVFSPS